MAMEHSAKRLAVDEYGRTADELRALAECESRDFTAAILSAIELDMGGGPDGAAPYADDAVCWRCMQSQVPSPGDWCGCVDTPRKHGVPTSGPFKPGYNPLTQPPVEEMTDEEREAEIAILAAGQKRGKISGGALYNKRVIGVGVRMYDADDMRRADRLFQRFGKPSTGGAGSAPPRPRISKPHHDSREQIV